jgi:hypothetical protein
VHDEDPVPRGVRFLPGLVSLVLAIAMTWPLLLHLGTDASQETYDTPFQTWQLAWIGHALLHHPLALFQSNTYWPEKDSLAFSDVLLGYAPAALIASPGPHAALAIHNLLVIFADALAFLGAYLLARELGAGRWGGLVAGAAYAYAPWRLVQTGHLHVISSGGIPLALYLLLRGYRRRSGRLILSGWLVAAWQITLGFTLGLQLAYLLAILAVLAAALWLRAGRPRPPGSVVDATAVGAAVFATTCIVVAQPYLRVLHHYPESRKTPAQIAYYSPSARAFLAAPSTDFVWSGLTAHWRNSGLAPGEGWLFPGLTVVLLAVLGLLGATYGTALRVGLAGGTILCWILSLGLPHKNPTGGFSLYRLLYEHAPGWDGVRTPGRINTLTSLGLALLAAAGVHVLQRHVFRRGGRTAATLVPVGLAAAVLVEGVGPLPHPRLPDPPPGVAAAPAPQLHLPPFSGDPLYTYWSIDRFPRIANGIGSFTPSQYDEIVRSASTFPDASSVAYLRQIGIESVVLHRDLAAGTPFADVSERSIAGLGITREDAGNATIYLLGSAAP